MKGVLINNPIGWVVNYNFTEDKTDWEQLPLHPDFVDMMDTCFRPSFSQEVEFEIIDEYSNPELYEGVPLWEGTKYAKLIKQSEKENL
jgi:hypothetical protein